MLKDPILMKSLVKEHLPDPTTCQGLWQKKSYEEVANNFAGFLVAVAENEYMLSRRVLLTALSAVCEGDRASLNAFAGTLVDSLQFCRGKLKNLKNGSKTSDAVKRVCEAWGKASSSCEVLEPSHEQPEETDEELIAVGSDVEPDEKEQAKGLLLKSMAMWGPPAARTLAKKDSIVSIGSSRSAPPSPAAGVEAKLPAKAIHSFLTPGLPYRDDAAEIGIMTS